MIVPSSFLFDECLTADLVGVAINHGFAATHVKHRGLLGAADRVLAAIAAATNAVFVTNNARDFRKLYRSIELHPGLVLILPSVSLEEQIDLMASVLERWHMVADTINKLVEIDRDGTMTVIDWSGDHLSAR